MKISDVTYIRKRRKELKGLMSNFFNDLSESCIPSYCHSNRLASFVAWNRLFIARNYHRKYSTGSLVLDFGAGSGELGHLLSPINEYSFIEELDELAYFINRSNPSSNRAHLDSLDREKYDAIFCLDSLEHNSDYPTLIDKLLISLKPSGVFIISGPTENSLYKLGRKISGFKGDYHETNIFSIENYLKVHLKKIDICFAPFRLPLFSISVWEKVTN